MTLLHFFQMKALVSRRKREREEEAGSVGCGQGPLGKKVTSSVFASLNDSTVNISSVTSSALFYNINLGFFSDEGRGGGWPHPTEASEAKGKNFHIFLATLSNMCLLVSVQTPMSVLGEKKRCL